MKEDRKGHIVNIASIAGLNGVNRLVDYCASKFAVVGLNEALNLELKVRFHRIATKNTNPNCNQSKFEVG